MTEQEQTQSLMIFLRVETPLTQKTGLFRYESLGHYVGFFPPLNIIFNRYFTTPLLSTDY